MRREVREISQLKTAMRGLPGYQAAHGAVFEQLVCWENARGGSTAPRQRKIGAEARLARETVNRAVGWLRQHGFIRTHQTFWRAVNGAMMKGRLVYWVAKEMGQVIWLKERWEQQRQAREERRVQRQADKERHLKMLTRPFDGPKEPDPALFSRCDPGITSRPRSESYSDDTEALRENLASPALQELMRKKGWRS